MLRDGFAGKVIGAGRTDLIGVKTTNTYDAYALE